MKKIIRKFKSKAEANKFKEEVLMRNIPGLTAQTYMRIGKPVCMVATREDMSEELYENLLGGQKNLAECAR